MYSILYTEKYAILPHPLINAILPELHSMMPNSCDDIVLLLVVFSTRARHGLCPGRHPITPDLGQGSPMSYYYTNTISLFTLVLGKDSHRVSVKQRSTEKGGLI